MSAVTRRWRRLRTRPRAVAARRDVVLVESYIQPLVGPVVVVVDVSVVVVMVEVVVGTVLVVAVVLVVVIEVCAAARLSASSISALHS